MTAARTTASAAALSKDIHDICGRIEKIRRSTGGGEAFNAMAAVVFDLCAAFDNYLASVSGDTVAMVIFPGKNR